MSLTEKLRLLVEADTKGAVSSIERLGSTAERELSRSEQRLDQWGSRLTKVGAGMITFGGAALAGLGAMAMASEEANLATVKLQNTLDNMPKLAGESSKQFTDLASAIQKKTAADADQIVAAEAMLGTFNLTAAQIKGITPLVVDYSRKFGVDMVDAATQVGKALDGQVGALKRNGVSIDEALFKTDRYAAVQQALSDQVGGFAEAEGKTFAGSIQRLKNELGDLAEGVGAGAVDAFSTMGAVVEGVTGKLNALGPETQSNIGKFATWGAVALVAAGGLSTLIGQAIKARQNFSDLASGMSNLTSRAGGLKTVLGAAGATGAVIGLGAALDAWDAAQHEKTIAKTAEAFIAMGDSIDSALAKFVSSGGLGTAAAKQLADKLIETNVEAAQRLIDTMEAHGAAGDVIDELRAKVEQKAQADAQGAVDQDNYTEATGEAADALRDEGDATDDARSALEKYNDALHAQLDPLFGAVSAANSLSEANAAVAEATAELDTATREHGAGSTEAAEAQKKLSDAELAASAAALDQESALLKLRDAVDDGTLSVAAANSKLDEWVRAGVITQASADETRRKFEEVAGAANSIPVGRTVLVSVVGTEDSRLKLVTVRDALGELHDRTLTIGVTTAIGAQAASIMSSKLLGRARGGPVSSGRIYEVNEDGSPELLEQGGRTFLLPGASDGNVVPMGGGFGGSAGGGSTPVVINMQGAIVASQAQFERMVVSALSAAGRKGVSINIRGREL